MSALEPSGRRRPPRRRSRGALVAAAIAVVAAFLLGLALGKALEDGPAPGQTRTFVRTLRPLPLPPAARTTVTTRTTSP